MKSETFTEIRHKIFKVLSEDKIETKKKKMIRIYGKKNIQERHGLILNYNKTLTYWISNGKPTKVELKELLWKKKKKIVWKLVGETTQ